MPNMAMSKEEAREYATTGPEDSEDKGPKYPYGLELQLNDDSLAKLGYTTPPAVGTRLTITATVEVTRTTQSQDQGGEAESNTCWQITDMEVGEARTDGPSHADLLYGV